MRTRVIVVVALVVAATAGCSQGQRQEWADAIRDGAKSHLERDALVATLSIRTEPRAFEDGAQRTSVVGESAVDDLAVRLRPTQGRAAIGARGQESAIFIPGIMLQRRPPVPPAENDEAAVTPEDTTDAGGSVTPATPRRATVATNIPALAIAPAETDGQGTSISSVGSRNVPLWLAVSFRILGERDDDRVVGAYGIHPLDILVLARGVLTGSVERVSDDDRHYRGRLGVDLAVRGRGDSGEDLLKTLRAHGVHGLVHDFDAWIDERGELRRFVVELDQELTTGDRGTLVLTLGDIGPDPETSEIRLPTHEEASRLDSFGQLVAIVGEGA